MEFLDLKSFHCGLDLILIHDIRNVLIQINNSSRNTLPNSIPVDIADEIEFHSIETRQFNAELIL